MGADKKRYEIEGDPKNLKENDKVKFDISSKGKAIIIPPDINVDDLLDKDTTKEPLKEEKPQEDPTPPSSNDDVEGTLKYVEDLLKVIQNRDGQMETDYADLVNMKNHLQKLITTVLDAQKEKE